MSRSMWKIVAGNKVLSLHATYASAKKALVEAEKRFKRARLEAPISESDLRRYRNYRL